MHEITLSVPDLSEVPPWVWVVLYLTASSVVGWVAIRCFFADELRDADTENMVGLGLVWLLSSTIALPALVFIGLAWLIGRLLALGKRE